MDKQIQKEITSDSVGYLWMIVCMKDMFIEKILMGMGGKYGRKGIII